MSALVTRSRCFRTIPSSYQLPRFAYVHPSRCRRIRALGTLVHNSGSPQLFNAKILRASSDGVARARALCGSLSISTAVASSSSSSRTRTAEFHTSTRVELPQFKQKTMKSFPRPKLASPSSVAPRGKSKSNYNPMPRKRAVESWKGRGHKGKPKIQKMSSSSPTVPAGPRPLKRHLFKKHQGPKPKELMEMLGRSAGPGSSIDPQTLAQFGEEMGVRQGLPGEYGAKQVRKQRLKKLRREIKRLTKLISRGYGDVPEEKARLAQARRELMEVEIRPNAVEGRKESDYKGRQWERDGSRHLGSSSNTTSLRPQKAERQSAPPTEQTRRESERPQLLESLRGIVTESENREEKRARATAPVGFRGVVADRGEGGSQGRSRGGEYSPMDSRDYFTESHSQPQPPLETHRESQAQTQHEPEPEPEPEPLSFETRRERQQSWSVMKEREWSRVGLRSAQEQDDLSSSTSGKGRIDARSLAVLAKQSKNSRVRYSPSAWAKASGAAPRFASPTPGRLGLGGSRRGAGADIPSERERALSRRKEATKSFEDRGSLQTHRGRRESPSSPPPHLAQEEMDHNATVSGRVRNRAADFARNTNFGLSREVEDALSEGAEEVEFYNPTKPVTSLSPSAALQDPLNTDAPRSRTISSEETATEFTSPPLLPGFLAALKEKFGEKVKPTPIQGLSVRWVLEAFGSRWFGRGQEQAQPETDQGKPTQQEWVEEKHSILGMKDSQITSISKFSGYRQFLLAAETGSGKSIAYLLPLLQNLKLTEHGFFSTPPPLRRKPGTEPMHAPRALVLAPTHELVRQLSAFAKDLCHFPDAKLRILCASVENRDNTSAEGKKEKLRAEVRRRVRGREGWNKADVYKGVVFDNDLADSGRRLREQGESGPGSVEEGRGRNAPVDVIVGTPLKLLEMAWGRGMEKIFRRAVEASRVYTQAAAQGDQNTRMDVTFGDSRWKPELGFENIEYVVVDEADVLFDRDFEETTRLLLADIAAARGRPVPYVLVSNSGSHDLPGYISSPTVLPLPSTPIDYPFHLILTSATIPTSLNNYLADAHPSMIRLASPRLHKLPQGLQTEYVTWSGGNKWRDVLFRLKRVWADDAMAWRVAHARAGIQGRTSTSLLEGRARSVSMGDEAAEEAALSKVVVFCNSSRRVDDLSKYFEENGVPTVAVTSGSEARRADRSNKYLKGFLREPKSGRVGGTPPARKWGGPSWRSPPSESSEQEGEAKEDLDDNDRESANHPNSESAATQAKKMAPLNSKATTPKEPKVLITTSLLSRGLDFSPEVKHVFIIDQPRNMIDFLHRAGRAARAGEKGKVVIFGKMRGRGSSRFRNVRGAVGRLSGR